MNLSRVMVGIITPSYNYSKYISKTIESVTRQSYKNWEMIIVDGLKPAKPKKKLPLKYRLIDLDGATHEWTERGVTQKYSKGE